MPESVVLHLWERTIKNCNRLKTEQIVTVTHDISEAANVEPRWDVQTELRYVGPLTITVALYEAAKKWRERCAAELDTLQEKINARLQGLKTPPAE